ncbi:MAG TPA: 50S ribosomal protein L25/general stress protein Ctc [Candidatus Berkiella sp.]|nr:50S ribosomal protein L25/general stress protein Ctc [Candidatus Berkiella sp.]
MAKFAFEIEYQPREAHGKGASRRLRNENLVLGVVYGGDDKPESITLNHFHVTKALENEAVYSHILTLTSNGKKQRVVLKDIQRHPYKSRVLHMDFLRISENKPIIMHVPLHFLGENEAPGVTLGGGTWTHHMVELEVKCLPRDLPEFIEVELSNSELNTIVHLSQIKLPKGVELTSVVHSHEDDLPVVSLAKSKRPEEDEAESETPTTEVEPKGKEAKQG